MTDKLRTEANSTKLNTLLFWGLAFLVLAAPCLRGLFYEIDYVRAQLFAGFLALLAGISLFKPKITRIRISLVDILALAFLFFYWLSITKALDLKEAVLGAFRATVYVFAFFLSKYLAQDKDRRKGIHLAVFFSTVLISLTALLQAIDVLQVELYNNYSDKRIISFLEHPNTFGVFSGLGILLGLGYLAGDGSRILRVLVACGIYFNTLGLMGSQSRGSWLIIIFGLFLQALLLSGDQRRRFLVSLAALLTVVLVTSKGFLDSFLAKDFNSSLTWLVIGAMLSLAGSLLLSLKIRLSSRYRNLDRYKTAAVISVCLLVAFCAFTYFSYTANYLPNPASQILTSEIIERAERISGQEGSYVGRMMQYRWALAIVADNPLTGWGEGGWESTYLRYQDRLLWSSEVHSHPLQLWVEIGIFGFAAYLGLWLLILGYNLKSFIFTIRNPLHISIVMAVLAVFLHSAIDFDLSLPGISLIFWTLGGAAAASTYGISTRSIRIPSLVLPALSLLLAVFLAIPAYGEYKAKLVYQDAQAAVHMGYHPMATDKLQEAFRLSPYSGDIAAKLALEWAYRFQDRGVDEYRTLAISYAEKSVQLEPYNANNAVLIAKAYGLLGSVEEQIAAQERLVSLVPKMAQLRLDLARSYYSYALDILEKGNIAEVRDVLAKSRKELEQIQENYLAAGKYWGMRPPITSYLLLGKITLLLGDAEQAIANLSAVAGDKNSKAEAISWLAQAYKRGQPEKYQQFYEKQVKVNPAYLKEYELAEQLLAKIGG